MYSMFAIYRRFKFKMVQKDFPAVQVQLVDENPRIKKRTISMKVIILGYPYTET